MSMEAVANRAILLYAIQRAIFCPYTGLCLDIRRDVLVGTQIMHHTAYDAIKDELPILMPDAEIIDGRLL